MNWLGWLGIWFGFSSTCDSVWSNGVGQNRETDEEHDENGVEEGFLLARVKYDRDGEGGREALGVENCSINIWDGSELQLAWSKKSSSYFKHSNTALLCYPCHVNLCESNVVEIFELIFCDSER